MSITMGMRYTIDLDAPLYKMPARTLLVEGDKLANALVVEVVRGKEPVDLAGLGVTGEMIRTGEVMPLTGSISGNTATLTLPQACYAVPGGFELQMRLVNTADGITRTILILSGKIERKGSGTIIDVGEVVPNLDDLLAQIDAMKQATAAAQNVVSQYDSKVAEQDGKISQLTEDTKKLNGTVYGNVPINIEDYEIGGMAFTGSGWTYVSGAKKIRTKEGKTYPLRHGDVISLNDFAATLIRNSGETEQTDLILAIGWLTSDGTYGYATGLTTDYVCTADGEYVIVVETKANDYLTKYIDPIKAITQKLSIREIVNSLSKRVESLEEATKETSKIRVKNPNCLFVAHQGYTSGDGRNQNRLEGYHAAAKHGFDYAETDIRLTSDGYIVCAHDTSFVDATTGETVVIADNTLAMLQTHDYYGSTIATFDDVVKACKIHGIGLMIDQTSSAQIINGAFDTVKKYGMQDRILWVCGINDAVATIIKTNYCNSNIIVVTSSASLDQIISFSNGIAESDGVVYASVPYTTATADQLAVASTSLENNVRFAVWTLNDAIAIKNYMPFVSAVISDKYCYNDLINGLSNPIGD